MRLRFTWTGPHEVLEVLAGSLNGRPIGADARVAPGGTLEVDDALLAEGAEHALHLHLSAPEVRERPLEELVVAVEWTHAERPPLELEPGEVAAAPAVTHFVRRFVVPWSWM